MVLVGIEDGLDEILANPLQAAEGLLCVLKLQVQAFHATGAVALAPGPGQVEAFALHHVFERLAPMGSLGQRIANQRHQLGLPAWHRAFVQHRYRQHGAVLEQLAACGCRQEHPAAAVPHVELAKVMGQVVVEH